MSEWIPVSERLPENVYGECSDDVLICVIDNDADDDEEQRNVYTGFYGYYNTVRQQGWWEVYTRGCHKLSEKVRVIAWMPLPKPYAEDM